MAVVTRNLKAARSTKSQLIVRHLPLPGHIKCCTAPVLEWIDKELKGAKVSILEYQPPKSTKGSLGRALNKQEKDDLQGMIKRSSLNIIGISQDNENQGKE